jgi:hypothetical protein
LAIFLPIFVGILLLSGRGFDDPDPTRKILRLGADDLDPETTDTVKLLLKANQLDNTLAVELAALARGRFSAAELQVLRKQLSDGTVPTALQSDFAELQKVIGSGDAAAYTLWVREDERPCRYDLTLDGVGFGSIAVTAKRSAIVVIGKPGTTRRLTITAASTNGASRRVEVESSLNEATTRRLGPGRSDTLELRFE